MSAQCSVIRRSGFFESHQGIFFRGRKRHPYFVSMMSTSFLCFVRLRNSNFSNFNRIKLKFGSRVDFGALISNFNSKVDKTSSFDEKRIIPLSLVKYSLNK